MKTLGRREAAVSTMAHTYAEANGLDGTVAAGLFMAAVAFAAHLDPRTLEGIRASYEAELPESKVSFDDWAALIEQAGMLA